MINLLLDECSDQISQQLFNEISNSTTIEVRKQVGDYLDPYVQGSIFIHNIRFETKNMLISILWHSFNDVRNEISDKVCSSVHFKVRNLVSATVCHESLAAIFF
jgi:hypothetical protein